MRELLDVIERELDSRAEGRVPDFELLRDVMDYILNFPDLVHHPKEDIIYKTLLARDPSARKELGDLLTDHATLASRGRGLAGALRSVGEGGEVPRDWFEKLVRSYLAALRSHMENEEQSVFPLALRKLEDADWLGIDVAVGNADFLALGKGSEERYIALHERIMRLAA